MAVAVMPRTLRLSIVPSSIEVRMLHKDEAGRKLHEQMGFDEGWNTALDQLIAVMRELKH
jgi:Activator of Hsp90 ATPase homolog 1-like protein